MGERKSIKKRGIGILAIVLFMLFTLGACSSNKATTVTYEKIQGGITLRLTYHAEGDKVTKQTAENTMPYSSIGVTTKEQAKKRLDPVSKQYQGFTGLEQSITYEDTYATETLVIDYTTVNIDEVKNLPGMTFDGDASKGISLKRSMELLESSGYTKVE